MSLSGIHIKCRIVLVALFMSVSMVHLFLNVIGPLNSAMLGLFGLSLVIVGHMIVEVNMYRVEGAKAKLLSIPPLIQEYREKLRVLATSKTEESKQHIKDQVTKFKMAIPPSLTVFVSDWSLFDILCLFYIIKDWAINFLAIGAAILMSHDPQEAHLRLMRMRATNKRLRT